jgi:hypothetical protein
LLAWLFNITWDSQGCSVNDWCPPRRTSDFCVCLACFVSEGTKSLSIGSLKWYRMVPAPFFLLPFVVYFCVLSNLSECSAQEIAFVVLCLASPHCIAAGPAALCGSPRIHW